MNSDPRNFEYLNSRVHTRESSTLMFSTVAVSASLILLGILIGLENPLNVISTLHPSLQTIPDAYGLMYILYKFYQNSYNWLVVVGILTTSFGIFYREITSFTIEKEDYNRLKDEYQVNTYENYHIISGMTRGLIVRLFFFISLDAWWTYKGFQILDSLYPHLLFFYPCQNLDFLYHYLYQLPWIGYQLLFPSSYFLYQFPFSHILYQYSCLNGLYTTILIIILIIPFLFCVKPLHRGVKLYLKKRKLKGVNEGKLLKTAKQRGIYIKNNWSESKKSKVFVAGLSASLSNEEYNKLIGEMREE